MLLLSTVTIPMLVELFSTTDLRGAAPVMRRDNDNNKTSILIIDSLTLVPLVLWVTKLFARPGSVIWTTHGVLTRLHSIMSKESFSQQRSMIWATHFAFINMFVISKVSLKTALTKTNIWQMYFVVVSRGIRNQESGIIYSRKFTIHAIYKRIHTVQGNMKLYSLMWPGDFH